MREKIKSAYIEYLLEHGKAPNSVYKFAKDLKMTEGAFYDYFNSFNALEKEIWKDYFEVVQEKLEGDDMYQQYSAREKLLAFYYTWVEILKNNRSYVVYKLNHTPRSSYRPDYLSTFRSMYIDYLRDLLNQAREDQEIVERKYLSDRYQDGLWLQLLFVLRFWVKDDSSRFEQTDAAIEKAVNLSFELMGKSTLESALDFAKFLYQNN
ncbi:MAG: TetR/AcrR family transcriptional regulator [Candidatus Cyclobacteriaceae bacterium M3_2C_046]